MILKFSNLDIHLPIVYNPLHIDILKIFLSFQKYMLVIIANGAQIK